MDGTSFTQKVCVSEWGIGQYMLWVKINEREDEEKGMKEKKRWHCIVMSGCFGGADGG